MTKEILINLIIEIETLGEESTREIDPQELPSISSFIDRCKALSTCLSLPKGKFMESSEDIDGAYPNCVWYGTMTINVSESLSLLDANRLLNTFQNFCLYHHYKLTKASANAVIE